MKICTDKRGFDKLLHFIMGAVVCLFVGVIFAYIPPHLPMCAALVAMSAVIVVAALKELHDSQTKGNHFCIWDFLWTVAGGFAASWLPWLTAYLLARNN